MFTRQVLRLPILPIRDTVYFPVLAFPISVGRSKSIGSSRSTQKRKIGHFAQREQTKLLQQSTSYEIGTMVKIIKHVKMLKQHLLFCKGFPESNAVFR